MFGASNPPRQQQQSALEPRTFAEAIVEAIDSKRKKKSDEDPTFSVKEGLKQVKLENLQACLYYAIACVDMLFLHIGTWHPAQEVVARTLRRQQENAKNR